MKKILLSSALFLSFFFIIVVSTVYAQPTGGGNPPTGGGNPSGPSIDIKLNNPFKGSNSLFDLLKSVINDILLPIGGVICVLAFIYTGFLYVTAQGNEGKLTKAHKALLYTSIGTAILLGSWVLANVICKTIGQLGGPVCQT